jgi:putative DNA primase/helicase
VSEAASAAPAAGDELLRAALYYAARGLFVFPLHETDAEGACSCGKPSCSSPGKHPRTLHGLKDASAGEEQVRSWWTRWPTANIAVNCGASGRVVVDVDVKDARGGGETWRDLQAQLDSHEDGVRLEGTAIVGTPSGGLHAHYLAGDHRVGSKNDLLGPGIDVKAEGGYVLLPPSRIAGVPYTWAQGHGLEQTAPLPAALAERLAFTTPRPNLRAVEGDDGGEGPITQGSRDDTLFRAACALRRRGHARSEIEALLEEMNKRCRPPLSGEELRHIAGSAMRYEPGGPRPRKRHCLNDDGNADRLIDAYGERIRYCDELGMWLIYDGRRWRRDRVREIEDLAAKALRGIGAEAAAVDGAEHKELLRWGLRSGDVPRIRAAIARAASDERVRIRASELDADPWLLTCLSGTLDLRSGRLRPHASSDLISRLAPCEWDPAARSEELELLLDHATGGDRVFAAFLRRAAGYSLTGLAGEEVFFLLEGPEATGKSTLTEALMATLGDYARAANAELFLARARAGGPREELVALDGARLVVVAEFGREKSMNEALLKQLTGGDRVSARGCYEREREFDFTAKLWFHTNFIPAMSDDDGAVWRRARIVPFKHTVAPKDRDGGLKARLCDPAVSGAAMLAWAAQGCDEWREGGLGSAPAVEQATRSVRESMDPLAGFFEDCCAFEPAAWTRNCDLKAAHAAWHGGGSMPRLSDRDWGARFTRRGATPRKRNGARGWLGVRLLDANEAGASDVQGH